jgi:hypothetical protein
MTGWDIRREGRAWRDDAMSRYQLTPEKTELIAGRLYATEEERLTMVGPARSRQATPRYGTCASSGDITSAPSPNNGRFPVLERGMMPGHG